MTARSWSRWWNGAIALLVVASLAIQLIVAVQAAGTPSGHAVGTVAGATVIGRLFRIVSFFTIQSNILSAVVCFQLARHPDRDGPVWRAVRLATLFGITVTGIVYGTVLAKVHEPHGWMEVSTNTVFHYIVPIMMVLGWLLFGPRPRITGQVVLWALAWPIAYFVFVMIRGPIDGWYPYPFVDAATHGYGRVLLNALLVTALFGLVGSLYWLGDRRLRRAPA